MGPRIPRRMAVPVILSALALGLAGCNTVSPGGSKLRVVATTTILGDVAQNVVGDGATVDVLIPLEQIPTTIKRPRKRWPPLPGLISLSPTDCSSKKDCKTFSPAWPATVPTSSSSLRCSTRFRLLAATWQTRMSGSTPVEWLRPRKSLPSR